MNDLFVVDAFTDEPFKGNPAAVCLLSGARPDDWLQNVAVEMNLSETAFVRKEGDTFSLRWFTPRTEVSLCGHATLASAHVLWSEGVVSESQTISFSTQSGLLQATMVDRSYELDFPRRNIAECESYPDLNSALGMSPRFTGTYQTKGGSLYLLEAESQEEICALSPDFEKLLKTQARAVIVTSLSTDDRYDFTSRFFAPQVGIDEDPVTGSAHCSLAPYWAQKIGRNNLKGYQVSARTGVVGCVVAQDRVYLRGEARTISSGKILV